MLQPPATVRIADSRVWQNPRIVDWGQLHCLVIWAYAGVPMAREAKSEASALTAWRVCRGRVGVRTPGGETSVSAGQWVLLPADGGEHRFTPDVEITSIRFQATWPDGQTLFTPPRPLVASAHQAEFLSRAADAMVRFVQQRISPVSATELNNESSDLGTFLELHALTAEWLRAYSTAALALGHRPSRIGLVDSRVLAAKQLLDASALDAPLPTAKILGAVGLSRKQLDRLLVAHTGQSLQRYFNARRLEFAVTALRTLPLTIKEISARVGFSETAAFSHWIRRITGRNPSQWRAQGEKQCPCPFPSTVPSECHELERVLRAG